MKKVLIVAPLETNGRISGGIMSIANTLLQSADLFSEKEIEVDGFNTYIAKRDIRSIGKLDLSNISNMILILCGLIRELKKNDINTIYYHSSIKMSLLKDLLIISAIKSFGRNIRIVLHIHFAEMNKILFSNTILKRYMLFVLKNTVDHIVFLSESTQEEFIQEGVSRDKCSVIYNYHEGRIDKEDARIKIEKYRKKKSVDYLFIGSIDKRKGIIDLLKAATRITEDFCLHICGECNDSSIVDEYERLLSQLGEKVICHGFVTGKEKEDILYNSDCLVLPSYGEGFPIVLVEGIANACSIITTPVGAVPEFLEEGINAYLFSPGEIDELADRMKNIIQRKEECANQMRRNYAHADDFSLDAFISRVIDII